MDTAIIADGWTAVPATGLYAVYIPRSRTLVELRTLSASEPLKKGWKVWGPFSSRTEAAPALLKLRSHYESDYAENRRQAAAEQLAEPLVSEAERVVDEIPVQPQPTPLVSAQELELIRSILFEDMKRAVREVLREELSSSS